MEAGPSAAILYVVYLFSHSLRFVFVREVAINVMVIEQMFVELRMWRHKYVHRATHESLQQLYEVSILNHYIFFLSFHLFIHETHTHTEAET